MATRKPRKRSPARTKPKVDRRQLTPFQPFEPMEFEIPSTPVPAFVSNSIRRLHWSVRHSLAKATRDEFAAEYVNQRPRWLTEAGPILGAVHVHVHVGWEEGRWPDMDAAMPAVKPMLDALQDAGIIKDDDQVEWLGITRSPVRGDRGYTTVWVGPYNPTG